ncbi:MULTISPECIES: lysine N(6)-hydroxylase/L-ornithine N(5)-oxygenase family protein [unclassified Nocardia]|uniref:lysine N(6)-hydroxylase/L-ornithine N(5)-oxygenase family protein n=1 Tax=unclassified Nocardia TaxID=2637762 RepID=UPI001CE468E4|nr:MULTISPECIES: SidA/IucD/PvdA family monooxygenase [unclassified Nocardia]
MSTAAPDVLDMVGIGFGPSGLALAIALEELPADTLEPPVAAVFFERKAAFGWHRNMLLPATKMQVAFLKDLVTFRNPRSRFGFVSYLHSMGRLAQFVNNRDFFPTRHEFHDYLEWAARMVADRVTYGAEVTGIRLPGGDPRADRLEIEVVEHGRDRRVLNARNVVISTGLVPAMPSGLERGERVWHSSEFIERFDGCDPRDLRRVVVAGAGQSAAEITRYLYDTLPDATIFAVIPSYGYSIADNTPFANQIFDPGAVDTYYSGSGESKEMFWRYHRNTNYSVVDDEVIRELYRRAYDDEVRNVDRLRLLRLCRVAGIRGNGSGARLSVHSLLDGQSVELDADLLVCATGYNAMQPAGLLGELDRYLRRDAAGRYLVTRDYRLIGDLDLPGIYLQGGTEHTHGLSSSLLSNIAVRSGEIAESILGRRVGHELESVVAADRLDPAKSWPAGVNLPG